MHYRLVIFDLDGTLLDTLGDLAAAANRALSLHGFDARTTDDIRRFVGNGVARLMRRALPEDVPQEVYERVLSDFRACYDRELDVLTRPYDGIPELLAALKAAGIHTAVNSNKPDAAVQRLCRSHFDGLLEMALGERAGIPKKPAPDGALHILRAMDEAPERALYVGDGEADLLTAKNAGMDCAWVSWGFRRSDELGDIPIPRAFDSAPVLRDFILGE